MKRLLTFIYLLAAYSLASTTVSERVCCRCAAFVSSRHMEIMVLKLPEVNITDCQSNYQCKDLCTEEINTLTNDMDLWSTVNGNTFGQHFCTELFQHGLVWIHNCYVLGYYEVCGGPWEYTGINSQQALCCTSKEHIHCVTK